MTEMDMATAAHQRPYSNATRGNIIVDLSVEGQGVTQSADDR